MAKTGKIPDFKDWRELPKPKNLKSRKTVAFQDGGRRDGGIVHRGKKKPLQFVK